jgi:hypothetical protein
MVWCSVAWASMALAQVQVQVQVQVRCRRERVRRRGDTGGQQGGRRAGMCRARGSKAKKGASAACAWARKVT